MRIVKQRRFITYDQIRQQTGLAYCDRTLASILGKEGLEHWIAKYRPVLSDAHAAERLAFARAGLDSDNTIFSDEMSIERGVGGQRVWAWGIPGDKYKKECVLTYNKGKDMSIMVWGAIWLGGRSDLVVMTRDIASDKQGFTARSYLDVLEDQIPRIYQPGKIFQQDNAPIYKARAVTVWLDEYGVVTVKWPACSPDLNPIENVWAILKDRLKQRFPDLADLGHGQEALDAFARAIVDTWNDIPQDIIDNCIKSVPKRLEEVIAAGGWYTRY